MAQWLCALPGLYGLTPLLADVRGLFTRYGWINDLLNIIDAPLENFINANYVPLPQVRHTRATAARQVRATRFGCRSRRA
jgi:hypothetical protein